MEMGSFIELQFPKGLEYYSSKKDVARLNTGRAAIYHALIILECNTIWLPFYQCDTVRTFLKRKGVVIKYYNINECFEPIDFGKVYQNEAVLLVNYFGIMSIELMKKRSQCFKKVIIDNSQAFFSSPIANAMNVYSTRKFFGVPDGAYVIGKNAHKMIKKYSQGYSSDTSIFLLQRIEYGCEGKAYKSKVENEKRLNLEDICRMSALTYQILDGTDYESIIKIRHKNFLYACDIFNNINKINPKKFIDEKCIPMVYPLVVEDNYLIKHLLAIKHFQGHWWSYLLDEMPKNSFEYWLSSYVIPITIDQRYSIKDIQKIRMEIPLKKIN